MVCVAALSLYNFAERDEDGDYEEYSNNGDDISGIVVDRIRAMKRQEETYRVNETNGNDKDKDNNHVDEEAHYQYRRRPCVNNSNKNNDYMFIDDIGNGCRTKMCQWFYGVADACGLSREIVAITMSYVDRLAMVSSTSSSSSFCSSNCNNSNSNKNERNVNILESTRKYQLANMTCLYTAMKLHENVVMDISSLVELGKGIYSANDFQDMEREILSALKWKMNEPTPLAFVRCYLQLYKQILLLQSDGVNDDKNNDASSSIIKKIMSHAKYQTEIAVAEISLFGYRPSEVALATITNSIIHFDMIDDISSSYLLSIRDMISTTITTQNNSSSSNKNSKTTAFAVSLRVSKLQNSLKLLLSGISPAGTANNFNDIFCNNDHNNEQKDSKQQSSIKKHGDMMVDKSPSSSPISNNGDNDYADTSSIKRSINQSSDSPINVSTRKLI